jgi:hypothetical protein
MHTAEIQKCAELVFVLGFFFLAVFAPVDGVAEVILSKNFFSILFPSLFFVLVFFFHVP